jgi:hypothetical protein
VELIFIYDEKKNINNLAAYAKGDKIVLENILFENNACLLNTHVFFLKILKKTEQRIEE